MKQPEVKMIVDLQFGSTGKGLIAGHLAENTYRPDTVVTAWSPNAGHTYIDANGRKYIHTMLANGVVSPNLQKIMIGPGTVLNINKLHQEIEQCIDHMSGVQVLIHPHATVLHQRHIIAESETMTGIGSTKKGSGAAMVEKIGRQVNARITALQNKDLILSMFRPLAEHGQFDINVLYDNSDWMEELHLSRKILVEGAQGYSLGINSGFYPYTTSRECTPAQLMVDCAIPNNWEKTVIGTCRTYPIRVANRYDDTGKQIGYSGPHYDDQEEIQWGQLGMEAELTTVTQLPRRLFTWSDQQVREACTMGGVDEIFLNFWNYPMDDGYQGDVIMSLNDIEASVGSKVRWLGHGPKCTDILDAGGITHVNMRGVTQDA